MAARDFKDVPYIPLVDLRPAEMTAIQSLPEKDKDLMLPIFKLRPWVGSNRLESSMGRLKEAYGTRPAFLMMSDSEPQQTPRDVHDQLARLRDRTNGYSAWCDFLEQETNRHFIPTMQLVSPENVVAQAQRLVSFDRGLLVCIELNAIKFLERIVASISQNSNGGKDVVFLLDFGRQKESYLTMEDNIIGLAKFIRKNAPKSQISISASSFPDSFTTIVRQRIYERQLFDDVSSKLKFPIIYSDRGGARAERQLGGGGAPAPRIDYAKRNEWLFFRDDNDSNRNEAYQNQAQLLVNSQNWDAKLRLWGTQMIERTALGDISAITSPARATAARINIHLHQQLYYNDPTQLYDTDEEWVD